MNKKGSVGHTLGIIIAVVAVALILLLLGFIVFGAKVFGYGRMCEYGCTMQDYGQAAGLYLLDKFGIYLMSDFCVTHHMNVYPDEWSKCNSTFEINQDVSSCLAEQMAELMRTCWVQRGGGEKDCDSLRCFIITVHGPIETYDKPISADVALVKDIMKKYKPKGKDEYYVDYLPLASVEFGGTVKPKQRWDIFYDEEWDLNPWSEDGVTTRYLGDLGKTIDFNKKATDIGWADAELGLVKQGAEDVQSGN